MFKEVSENPKFFCFIQYVHVVRHYQWVIRLNYIQYNIGLAFILQLSIAVRSVIFSIKVCIISAVTSTQSSVARQFVSPAWTSLGCAMGFALTSDQLRQWCSGTFVLVGGYFNNSHVWVGRKNSVVWHHTLICTRTLQCALQVHIVGGELTAFCQMFAKQMPPYRSGIMLVIAYRCPLSSSPSTQSWPMHPPIHPSPPVLGCIPIVSSVLWCCPLSMFM